MFLRVPEFLSKILWEGPLEPATDDALERLSREWTATGVRADAKEVVRDLPILSIGQPEVWPLAEAYPRDRMPPLLQVKLGEANFYLVRLACSLRPVRDHVQVDWIRFKACLGTDDVSHQPIAFDLHPLQVTQRVRRDVKVTINPTLRFQEVEASLVGIEFGFEYPELVPVISAAGAGESTPSWDYEAGRGIRLQGSKWMHLLVKAPLGTSSCMAILGLVADVAVHNSRLPVLAIRDQRNAATQLVTRLWGKSNF